MRYLLVAGTLFTILFASSTVWAGPEQCANIIDSSDYHCETRIEGGCVEKCTTPSYRLACDTTCKETCHENPETVCTKTCDDQCVTDCTVNTGSFSCGGSCSVDCRARCETSCENHPYYDSCVTSCNTSCGVDCSAGCNLVLPSASCETKCEKVCGTSCKTTRNVICGVTCQTDCVKKLESVCHVQCTEPRGAIFCDGQYISADDVASCVSYIRSIQISISIGGLIDLAGGCQASQTPTQSTPGILLFGLMLLGIWRRRVRVQ